MDCLIQIHVLKLKRIIHFHEGDIIDHWYVYAYAKHFNTVNIRSFMIRHGERFILYNSDAGDHLHKAS